MADPAEHPTAPSPPPQGRRRRPLLRWLGRGALVLLLLLAVLAGATVWLLRTDSGRTWLTATVLDLVNGIDGVTVTLGALEGDLPLSLRLVDLTVADAQGVWLSADRIGLAWNPAALLDRRLHVTDLTASALAVERAPVLPGAATPPEDAPGGGFDPRLLGAVRLDRLALRDIRLGAALVGQPVALDIDGRLAGTGDPADPTAVAAHLQARRIDGQAASLTLDARLHGPALDRLAVAFDAREARGGAVTTLAGLPGAAGWTVSLSGDGPLSAWTGRLEAAADGLVSAGADLTLDIADPAAPALSLDLEATPGDDLPAAGRTVMTDRLTLSVSAARAADGSLAVDDLTLTTDALGLVGAGRLDPGAGTVTASLDALLDRSGRLAPLADLPLASAALSLRADGPLTAPTVTADINLREAGAAGLGADTVTLTVTATPDGPLDGAAPTVALDLSGRIDGLRGPPAVTGILPHPLEFEARGSYALADGRASVDALRVADARGLTLTADGAVTLAPALDGAADARLAVAGLGRLAPLLGGLSPRGAADLTLSGVTVDAEARVTGDVRLSLTDTALGLAPADAVLGPAPTLTGRVSYDPGAGLRVEGVDLDGAHGRLAGTLGIDAGFSTFTADAALTLDDVGRVAGATLQGGATLNATLSGALADPDVAATARMPAATLAGQAWDDITLEVRAAGLASGATGSARLAGTGPGGRLDLAADLALPGYARAAVSDLVLTVPGARLTGAASTAFDTALTTGDLTLTVGAPAALADWGLPALSGALDATVALTAADGRQHATLTARAPALALAEADIALGALALDATLADALGRPTLDARIVSRDGGTGGVRWSRLTARATGPLPDLAVTADLAGEGPTGALTLAAAARLQPPGLAETGRVVLERLDLDSAGHRVTLRRPATLALDGAPRVDRLDLALDDGTLTVEGGLTADGGADLRLTGTDLPLNLADLAVPDLGAGGRLDLTAALRGRLPEPRGTLSLRARDVTLAQTDGAPPLAAEASARLEDGRLRADATLRGFAATPARLTADLPLRLGDGPPVPDRDPLSAQVDWDGPVARVWEMLPLVDHRLEGDLTLHAALSGTLAAPTVEAEVRLAQGRYEHLTLGTLVENLTVSATAAGSERIVVSLSGTDGGDGRLAAEGAVRLGGDGPTGEITATVEDAVLLRRDDVTARADADLTVALEGTAARVSGRVRTEEVRGRLVGGGGAAVQGLDVVEIDDPSASAMAALEAAAPDGPAAASDPEVAGTAAGTAAFPIRLDIAVDLPNRVYVSGQGLESEWGGALAVGGTAAAPRITGTIAVRRGVFEAVGRSFTIETGEVRFAGGTPVNPLLDVIALYETPDLEARVGLRGPARDPALVLESVPPLPRDEVLSRILFGKRAGALTTLETVQLARALASLSGVTDGGGAGLLDGLRQAAGLDVLSVGGEGLEAGTYLSDDVYVGVEQGIAAGSGGVTVEVDLGAGFTVESKAARTGRGEVGVMWHKDY